MKATKRRARRATRHKATRKPGNVVTLADRAPELHAIAGRREFSDLLACLDRAALALTEFRAQAEDRNRAFETTAKGRHGKLARGPLHRIDKVAESFGWFEVYQRLQGLGGALAVAYARVADNGWRAVELGQQANAEPFAVDAEHPSVPRKVGRLELVASEPMEELHVLDHATGEAVTAVRLRYRDTETGELWLRPYYPNTRDPADTEGVTGTGRRP